MDVPWMNKSLMSYSSSFAIFIYCFYYCELLDFLCSLLSHALERAIKN